MPSEEVTVKDRLGKNLEVCVGRRLVLCQQILNGFPEHAAFLEPLRAALASAVRESQRLLSLLDEGEARCPRCSGRLVAPSRGFAVCENYVDGEKFRIVGDRTCRFVIGSEPE